MEEKKKEKKKEKKEYIVVIPDDVNEKIKNSSVAKEVEEVIQKLMKGEMLGDKMDLVDCETQLLCGECDSDDVSWTLDKNSNEVYFKCFKCGESSWMYEDEYKATLKKYPDCIIKKDIKGHIKK